MAINFIHSYLVHPGKHDDVQPEIQGALVDHRGGLFELLRDVYRRSASECKIEIVFNPNEDGEQENGCHDALIEYVEYPEIESGRRIALRLQRVTTHRSGLGLLFLIEGQEADGRHTLVVSRFPADQGILAEETRDQLSIQFVERVFMRNARAYKSVIFQTRSLEAGFAVGRAVDHQISGPRELSDYWVRNFLESELKTTAAAGTRRLARSLRDAIRNTPTIDVKHELISAVRLLRGFGGTVGSTHEMIRRLQLSTEATSEIGRAFQHPVLMIERFQFDAEEFVRHATYRIVELDNGAMLSAEDEHFDEIFEAEKLVAEESVRYSTEGRVVDEKIKQTK